MKTKQDFLDWLEAQGALDSFNEEAEVCEPFVFDSVQEMFKDSIDEPREFISSAFSWELSELGFEFWEELDNIWCEVCA